MEVLQQLEVSANVLLAPPNQVTPDLRRAAEEIFKDFQNTRCPYSLCRTILDNSKVPFLLFQAASTLKIALLREWGDLEPQQIVEIKNYLLEYLKTRRSLEHSVREQLALVIAIIAKREFISSESDDVILSLVTELSNWIAGASLDNYLATVGCSILRALLNEFSSSTRSSDIGIAWENHILAKRRFQNGCLRQIFEFVIRNLNQAHTSLAPPFSPEALNLVRKFLDLAEQVFSWSFHTLILFPRKLIRMIENQERVTFRPTSEWSYLLTEELPQLFYKLLALFSSDHAVSHQIMQCLIQLAAAGGSAFASNGPHTFVLAMLEGVYQIIGSGTVATHLVLNTATIINKIAHFNSPPALFRDAESLHQERLVQQLTPFTVYLIESAAHETFGEVTDDSIFHESLDLVLEMWNVIINGEGCSPDVLKQAAVQITHRYIQMHLSRPEGNRPEIVHRDYDDDEEDDRSKYDLQLVIMGELMRESLESCVPLLCTLLENRLQQFQLLLQNGNAAVDDVERISEDLHWLVLLAAHAICVNSDDIRQPELVPAPVIAYSLQCSQRCSLETSVEAIQGNNNNINLDTVDPICRLIACVLRLSDMETAALQSGMHVSDEVGQSIMWFLNQLVAAYLLPDESSYTQMSPTLTAAFARDSASSQVVVQRLLAKIHSNLALLRTECIPLSTSCFLRIALISTRHDAVSAATVNESGLRETLVQLITELQVRGVFPVLPTLAKHRLMQGIVLCLTLINADQVWNEQLLDPLNRAMEEVGRMDKADPKTRVFIVDLLERLCGLCKGITSKNVERLSSFLVAQLEKVVVLADVYHYYQEVVSAAIQLLTGVVRNSLCLLEIPDAQKVYTACIKLIETYAQHKTRVIATMSKENDSEEQYQDLLDFMELLNNLLMRDLIALAGQPEAGGVMAVYVGLRHLMRLMNLDLLRCPELCTKYFHLITYVGELYPKTLFSLPEDLLENLIQSIRWGLTEFTPEVSGFCLEFVVVLGAYCHFGDRMPMSRSPPPPAGTGDHERLKPIVAPFLPLILDMSVRSNLDAELTATASQAIFALMQCFPEEWQRCCQSYVDQQPDALKAPVREIFQRLTTSVPLEMSRQNRAKFRSAFENFVVVARGLLCIK